MLTTFFFPEYNSLQRLDASRFGLLQYWWVILMSLGFLPALLLSNVLVDSVSAAG